MSAEANNKPAFSPDVADLLERSVLYREGVAEREEILRHKWFESRKVGYDIGFENACVSWMVHHRARWRIQRQRRLATVAEESRS